MGEKFTQTPNPHEQERELIREGIEFVVAAAQVIQKKCGKSLADVIHDHTNLHEVIMRGDTPDANWKEFAEGLPEQQSPAKWITDFVEQHGGLRERVGESRFGCFSYGFHDDKTVAIHFGNSDRDALSPLSDERQAARLADLRNMFMKIREEHPDAKEVRGFSWLYNLDSYKRLFPPSFVKTATVDKYPENIRSAGLWGQFLTASRRVNKTRVRQFLENLERVDMEHLEDAFPFQVLAAHAPIEDFYQYPPYKIPSPDK